MALFDIGSALDGLFGLAGEFIEDKDKRNEFNMEIMKVKSNLQVTILEQKTHPFIDGLVKLMFATKELYRPIMGIAMTLFGAYAHYKGIDLGNAHYIFDGAAPAWGLSRHMKK